MKFINNLLKICSIFIFFSIQNVSSEENKIFEKDHEWNFYSGIFDFSDDGKRASLFGIQHQNENLVRDSFFRNIVTCYWIYDDSR
ncbi:hypothetical protein OA079_03065 [Candidatus Pelagibacter sp.]|nr:hypothetical protein [Candidatus Pelagibacter sp.]